jgi:hypothetical protein
MVWLLVFVSICAINVVAGRAYSRYLDRLEARSSPLILIGSPDRVDQIVAAHLAAEKDHNFTSLAPGDDWVPWQGGAASSRTRRNPRSNGDVGIVDFGASDLAKDRDALMAPGLAKLNIENMWAAAARGVSRASSRPFPGASLVPLHGIPPRSFTTRKRTISLKYLRRLSAGSRINPQRPHSA